MSGSADKNTAKAGPSPLENSPHLPADLASSLYGELRRLAAAKMKLERRNHTLQPTALVHEVCMRLAGADSAWQDRPRLLGFAAHMMRQILVDHARARNAARRGGGSIQVTLVEDMAATGGVSVDILAVDVALNRLAEFDQRQSTIVELRYFAGLTFEEIASELGLSARTIKRDWTMARAWLHQELSSQK